MASFEEKFPVLQELFAKNQGAFGLPSGARVNPACPHLRGLPPRRFFLAGSGSHTV